MNTCKLKLKTRNWKVSEQVLSHLLSSFQFLVSSYSEAPLNQEAAKADCASVGRPKRELLGQASRAKADGPHAMVRAAA